MTTTPPDDSPLSDAAPVPTETPATADQPTRQRERPRYGEYAPESATPSAPVPPTSAAAAPAEPVVAPVAAAPQFSSPPQQPPAPQYSPPPQYTGYQSPLGTSAPGYAYPGQAIAPAPGSRPKTVGVIAFVVSLVVLIGTPIATAFVAQGLAPLTQYYAGGGTMDTSDIPADQQSAVALAGLGVLATVLFCAVFGLWALIQGIVATASNRGRIYGILAIVFSVLAPIVSVIVFNVVFVAAAPALT